MDPLPPLPPELQGLPQDYADNTAASNIERAYRRLTSAYDHAIKLIADGECDPLRLKIAADKLAGMTPLLQGLSSVGVPAEWVALIASLLKEVIQQARRIAEVNAGWVDEQ